MLTSSKAPPETTTWCCQTTSSPSSHGGDHFSAVSWHVRSCAQGRNVSASKFDTSPSCLAEQGTFDANSTVVGPSDIDGQDRTTHRTCAIGIMSVSKIRTEPFIKWVNLCRPTHFDYVHVNFQTNPVDVSFFPLRKS
ncbi:hypothetical protein Rs2_42237 [Raphanus sativus]|nr:hypothetical protein Rs2_42237 [Raphanus sativus]